MTNHTEVSSPQYLQGMGGIAQKAAGGEGLLLRGPFTLFNVTYHFLNP
jgi:hypothetical protein